MVFSLDASSFLNALHRFISRRGSVQMIVSDNGTNFVGGDREQHEAIKEWNKHAEECLKQKLIVWKFNPPASPHWGGVWERQVRTVKKTLQAVCLGQRLDDESLITLLCQIEAIENGRPLIYVSDDIKDEESLTPNHILMLRTGPTAPPGIFVKQDASQDGDMYNISATYSGTAG